MPGLMYKLENQHSMKIPELWKRLILGCLLLLPLPVLAQQGILLGEQVTPVTFGEGWRGFTDLGFMFSAFMTMLLSAVLGAILGYHPCTVALANTVTEVEAPKVYILCSVIGSIIGIMVVKYGMVVGFVVFGIGGLMRFRTLMGSANQTGNVILVTMVGLSCGLNLPHIAVLATLFGFILTYILDARPTYSISIKGIKAEEMPAAVSAYRAAFEKSRCHVISERKKLNKETLIFIFHNGKGMRREDLEQVFETEIPEHLRGAIDWVIE
jgi:hypothetical protein